MVAAAVLAICVALAGCGGKAKEAVSSPAPPAGATSQSAEVGESAGTAESQPTTTSTTPTPTVDGAKTEEKDGTYTTDVSGFVADCETNAANFIIGLVCAWYGAADPKVCDFMTDRLLRRGWGTTGDLREQCRSGIANAQPVKSIRLEAPRRTGDSITVRLSYIADDGKHEIDSITLVSEGGKWLLDEVEIVELAP
jgi:hypothetical protein